MSFTRPDVGLSAIAELAERRQWVVWAPLVRDPAKKATKVLFRTNGVPAAVNRKAGWATFEEACAAAEAGVVCTLTDKKTGEVFSSPAAGVGIVLTDDDPYTAIDLDDCINGNGIPGADALAIADSMKSYTERSPSGTGLRIMVRGGLKGVAGKRKGKVEAYSTLRYVTITGNALEDYPDEIADAEEQVQRLYHELGATAGGAANGAHRAEPSQPPEGQSFTWDGMTVVIPDEFPSEKLLALLDNSDVFAQTWNRKRRGFNNHDDSLSSYDLSIAYQLLEVGWTDHEIAAALARFRSRHGSNKWERPDYLPRTIDKARRFRLQGVSERIAVRDYQAIVVAEAASGMPTTSPPTAPQVGKEALSTAGEVPPTDERKEKLMGSLAARLGGIPLKSVLQTGSDPALYFFEMQDGKQIRIGDEKAIFNQRVIQGRIGAELRVVMPMTKAAVWQETVGILFELLEVRDIEETRFSGRMREMIELYLEKQQPEELEPLTVDGSKPAIAFEHKPFVEGGMLHLSMTDLGRILSSHADFKDMASLKSYLIAIGFKVAPPIYAKDPTSDKGTTRSYWRGRAELFGF